MRLQSVLHLLVLLKLFGSSVKCVRQLILFSPAPIRFSNSEAIQAHRSISDRAEPVQQHSQEAIARGTQPRSAARARLCDDEVITITQLFGIGCVFQLLFLSYFQWRSF